MGGRPQAKAERYTRGADRKRNAAAAGGARFIREAVEREIKRRGGEPAQQLRDQFA